jgi:hypothetical protein
MRLPSLHQPSYNPGSFGEGFVMRECAEYQYLQTKPGSNYEQLFCGRIRAEVLYRETVGREP